MLISQERFNKKEYHIQMGRESAQRCIDSNGFKRLFHAYCPLNLKNDAAGKRNEAEFKIGWDEVFDKHTKDQNGSY